MPLSSTSAETRSSAVLADLEVQYEAAEARAAELVDGLSDAQLQWRPEPGRWSITLCLGHLNAVGYELLPRIDRAVADARSRGLEAGHDEDLRLGMLNRLFLRWLEPPHRTRAPAPKIYLPRDGAEPRDVAREFVELQGELIKRLWEADGLDLAKIRIVSPASRLIRFHLGMWFAFLAAHQRRHLWQAGRVRSASGFPAG